MSPGKSITASTVTPAPWRPKAKARRNRSHESTAFAFLLPLVALEFVLVVVPLALAVYYSLYRVDYFELTSFRGFGNYVTVLTSPMVLKAVASTLIFAAGSLVLTLGFGFALALRFEVDTRTSVAMRSIVLVPYVISMLVGSLLLRWLYSSDGGLSSMALSSVGMGDFSILADPNAAMAALVSNAVWRDSAFAMILLLAGLKSIPQELHAAARVDGASAWMRFHRITLPMLRIPLLIAVVRLLIHFVNVLTFALVLTGGGPNNATQTMGLALYRLGFVDFQLGEANALATLVFLFNIALIACNLALFKQRKSP